MTVKDNNDTPTIILEIKLLNKYILPHCKRACACFLCRISYLLRKYNSFILSILIIFNYFLTYLMMETCWYEGLRTLLSENMWMILIACWYLKIVGA